MTTAKIRSQVQTLLARGKKLSAEDVKSLVGAARDGGKVYAAERNYLASLPTDAFQPGARENLETLLAGTKSAAFVDLAGARGTAALGRKEATGAAGVTLRFEDGLGQLTQNHFWLEGAAKADGPVTVRLDGHAVTVTAKKGETAAALAAKLAAAMPKGFSANVNANFPGGKTAALQVFRKDPMPPALLQPIADGKQKPVKVLITGYGKFSGYPTDADNPSWQMAQKIAAKKFPGAEVQAVLLPVEWSKVDAFAKTALDTYKPDVIINLGAGRHTIEYWAENKTDGEDAAGQTRNGEPAVEGGSEFLTMSLPEEAIEKALARTEDTSKGGTIHLRAGDGGREQRLADAKQEQANDWGNKYLCNYLNYRMLDVTRGKGIMSGFFHVDETTAPQELEVVVEQAVIAKLQQRQDAPAAVPGKPIG